MLTLTSSAAGQPPVTALGAYTLDGPVHDIVETAGRTFVGGDFKRVGLRVGSGVALSPRGARAVFPEVAGGEVRAVVADGRGGWYIGGTFTHVGGQAHLGLAHIDENGQIDPKFNPVVMMADGRRGAVNALAYSTHGPDGGWLYVGGRFDAIGPGGGEPRENLAAISGVDGRPDRDFGPITGCEAVPSCSPAVHALALAQPTLQVNDSPQQVPLLFVAGEFTQLGASGEPADVTGLGAVWGIGALDSTGGPKPGALVAGDGGPWKADGEPPRVLALALPHDLTAADTGFPVYAGGDLASAFSANSKLAAYQIRLDPNTHDMVNGSSNRFANWRPWANGKVRSIATAAGKVYFGGDFTAVSSGPALEAGHLAQATAVPRVDGATPVWHAPDPGSAGPVLLGQPFGAGLPGRVRAVALGGGTIFAGGEFSAGVVALQPSGATGDWTSPMPDAPVLSLGANSGAVYVGGEFRGIEARPFNGLAAFDSGGALVADWDPAVGSGSVDPPQVRALAAAGDTVYVAGQFDSVDGFARDNLAAVDAGSGEVQSFDFDVSRRNGPPQVTSLAVTGSTLYVGGAFDSVGGHERRNLAAIDTAGGSVTTWNPAPDDNVYAVLPGCGAVFAGGAFGQAGGQTRAHLAALDPATGAALPWRADANGSVFDLARSGPTLYVGGNFGHVGGQTRQKVAGVRISDGAPTSFNGRVEGPVYALAVSDAAVYVGGRFDRVDGQNVRNLAVLNSESGALDVGWQPSPNRAILALRLGGDALHAVGEFVSVGADAHSGLARFFPGAGELASTGTCATSAPSPSPGVAPENNAIGVDTGGLGAVPQSGAAPARIVSLRVMPKRLRLRRGALRVRFVLPHAARVRLRLERRCPGRRPRCAGYRRFAEVVVRGRRGITRVSFRRQAVGGRRLALGRYRLSVTVLPAARAARHAVTFFTVVR